MEYLILRGMGSSEFWFSPSALWSERDVCVLLVKKLNFFSIPVGKVSLYSKK